MTNIKDKSREGEQGMEKYWELKIELPNTENQKVINEFLLSRKKEGWNKERISNARYILQFFFKDWAEPYSSITLEDIRNRFNENERQWSKWTVATYTSVLRSFYGLCVQVGYMEKAPLKKTKWVKAAEKYWEIQIPLPNIKNQDMINSFLLHLKNKNRSKNTIDDIRSALQRFFRDRKEPFDSVTSEDIQQWVDEFKRDRERHTVVNFMSFLRTFYRFCIVQGELEESPVLYQWDIDGSKERYWVLKVQLPNEENQEVINEFLVSMKVANKSKETITRYQMFLSRFFLNQDEAFYKLGSDTIQQWLIEKHKGLKESTIVKNLGMISSFYRFCVKEGYMEKSPIKSRWYPRLPKPVPRYLERGDIAKLRMQSEKEKFRNRVILELLMVTGCRIGEVHRLNRANIDLENRTARVIGKGGKIRTVHFTEKCALNLERYLESREDKVPSLFVTEWGTKISKRQLYIIIKKMGERAKLSSNLHPHRLRHTFATELLAKGANLLYIADELGHKDIQTTLIYAQLPDRELVSMYRKYMG